MRTALIDGDVLVYTAAESAAKETDWGDGLWTLHAEMNEAIPRFDDIMAGIMAATKSDKAIVALSADGERWRTAVMPTYKAKRKGGRRPLVYNPLRQHCHDTCTTYERPLLEGDDILGILMTHPDLVEGEKVCVTVDKDLLGITGEHFNHEKPELGIRTVTQTQADYFHLYQTLTGDAVDGYPGCPGVGPKGAEKILAPYLGDDYGGMLDRVGAWKAIVAAYKKAGLGEAVALQNARVARILRATDFDFEARKVLLWNP